MTKQEIIDHCTALQPTLTEVLSKEEGPCHIFKWNNGEKSVYVEAPKSGTISLYYRDGEGENANYGVLTDLDRWLIHGWVLWCKG